MEPPDVMYISFLSDIILEQKASNESMLNLLQYAYDNKLDYLFERAMQYLKQQVTKNGQ